MKWGCEGMLLGVGGGGSGRGRRPEEGLATRLCEGIDCKAAWIGFSSI